MVEEIPILFRIATVDSGPENRHRIPSVLQSDLMAQGIYPIGSSGYDPVSLLDEWWKYVRENIAGICSALPRTDYRYEILMGREYSSDIEKIGANRCFSQELWIRTILQSHNLYIELL